MAGRITALLTDAGDDSVQRVDGRKPERPRADHATTIDEEGLGDRSNAVGPAGCVVVTALGERQYRCLLLRMKAARTAWPAAWLFVARSWLV